MRSPSLAAAALLLSSSLGFSATFSPINSINSFFGGTFFPILDELGVPLENGTSANGDGDLIVFGMLDDSTGTNLDPGNPASWPAPAWSTFYGLTGEGSNNHAAAGNLDTTMGDGDPGLDGFYSIGVTLNDTNHPDLPAGGQLLAVRFYNGKTIDTSTHYTTVTAQNTGWLANTTLNQPGAAASLDLDNNRPDLVWEGGIASQTNIPIPEPSTALLGLLGMVCFLRRRR